MAASPPSQASPSSPGGGCVLCCGELEVVALGRCEHPVCFRCSVRMRALCGVRYCAVCREELAQVRPGPAASWSLSRLPGQPVREPAGGRGGRSSLLARGQSTEGGRGGVGRAGPGLAWPGSTRGGASCAQEVCPSACRLA